MLIMHNMRKLYTQIVQNISEAMQFRSIKLGFLIFEGENPIGWVYKVNHYFALNPMLDQ